MQGVTGTTTPIGEGVYIAPPVPEEGIKKATYGPLTNTYTDKKTGLSFKYPDELRVVDTGDGIALQHTVDKQFSLKICGADDLCATGLIPNSAKSLADLEGEYAVDTEGVVGTQRVTPLSNTIVQTDSGVSVLKQTYVTKILDESGNDITARECEMCVGEKTRYILFKNPQDFFVLRSGQLNDLTVEAMIIQSITY
jgi:hypothetical protein